MAGRSARYAEKVNFPIGFFREAVTISVTPNQLRGVTMSHSEQTKLLSTTAAIPPIGADDPLLSTEAAAEYLGVSPGTLANWRTAKKGPPYALIGSVVRYRKSAIDRYCEANTVGAVDARARKSA